MESPSKIITDTDNSILQLSSSEKKIITLQNSEEEKEQHELQTACFGKFNLNHEDVFDISDSYSPSKKAKIDKYNQEEEIEATNILNSCAESKQKENKLSGLSNLLKLNPDLLGVTDPTDDEKLEMFIQKLNQDIASKFREANSQSGYDDETPEKISNMSRKDETPSVQKEINYEEKYLDLKHEPSEKSFSEYDHLEPEIECSNNDAKLKDISSGLKSNEQEKRLNQQNTYKAKSDEIISSPKKSQLNIQEIKQFTNEAEKPPSIEENKNLLEIKRIDPISEVKSYLEDSNGTIDEINRLQINKTFEYSNKSIPSAEISKIENESKKISNLMSYLDNVEEESNHELSMSKYSSPSKQRSEIRVVKQFNYESQYNDPILNPNEKSKIISLEIEIQELYSTIEALK